MVSSQQRLCCSMSCILCMPICGGRFRSACCAPHHTQVISEILAPPGRRLVLCGNARRLNDHLLRWNEAVATAAMQIASCLGLGLSLISGKYAPSSCSESQRYESKTCHVQSLDQDKA